MIIQSQMPLMNWWFGPIKIFERFDSKEFQLNFKYSIELEPTSFELTHKYLSCYKVEHDLIYELLPLELNLVDQRSSTKC